MPSPYQWGCCTASPLGRNIHFQPSSNKPTKPPGQPLALRRRLVTVQLDRGPCRHIRVQGPPKKATAQGVRLRRYLGRYAAWTNTKMPSRRPVGPCARPSGFPRPSGVLILRASPPGATNIMEQSQAKQRKCYGSPESRLPLYCARKPLRGRQTRSPRAI